MELREMGCEVLVETIYFAQNSDQWRRLVNDVMNITHGAESFLKMQLSFIWSKVPESPLPFSQKHVTGLQAEPGESVSHTEDVDNDKVP